MKLTSLLFFLFSVSFSPAAFSSSHIEREEAVKGRVEKTLIGYLGKPGGFLVTVHEKTTSDGESEDAPVESGELMDLGYMSVPKMDSKDGGEADLSSVDTHSYDVRVFLSDGLNTSVQDEAHKVLSAAMGSIKAEFKMESMHFPEVSADGRSPASTSGNFSSPFSPGSENNPVFIYLIAILALGAGLAAFVILSRSIRGSAEALAGGIKEMAAKSPSSGTLSGLREGASDLGDSSEREKPQLAVSERPHPLPEVDADATKMNLEMIRKTVQTEPILLLRTLENSASDLTGMRWILPFLDPTEQTALQNFLGPARIKSILGAVAPQSWVPWVWLQSYAERLTLKRIGPRSELESALSKEQLSSLFSTDMGLLSRALAGLSSTGAIRIACEVLTGKDLSDYLKAAPADRWSALLDSLKIKGPEIVQGFLELQAELKKINEGDGEGVGANREFFDKTLLASAVEALRTLPFGEDDRLLAELKLKSPELEQTLLKKVWTTSILKRLDWKKVSELADGLDTDQVFALIVGLPDPWGKKVEDGLMAGRRREIVTDLVVRARQNPDPKGLQAAHRVCRNFLEHLRKLHAAGRLELEPEAVAEAVSSKPASTPKVAVDNVIPITSAPAPEAAAPIPPEPVTPPPRDDKKDAGGGTVNPNLDDARKKLRAAKGGTYVPKKGNVYSILFFSLLASAATASSAWAYDYCPKLSLRTGAGMFSNSGSEGGQSASIGGFNLVYSHFLTERLSAGVGYRADFDIAKKTMPVWGYDLSGRYYYYGRGTMLKSESEWGTTEVYDPYALYIGMDYSKREYFLGPDSQSNINNAQVRGDYSAGVIAVGGDVRWHDRFGWNFELSTAFLTFAASDPRYKLDATTVSFGLTYIFR